MKKLTVWVAALLAMMLFAAGGALGEEGRLPEDGAYCPSATTPRSFRAGVVAILACLRYNGSAAGSAWRRAGEVL